MNDREIIFEYRRLAEMVEVSAMHVNSGREIAISVPASLTKDEMKQIALKRLTYVMNKESHSGN